jgi:hypothetical protein
MNIKNIFCNHKDYNIIVKYYEVRVHKPIENEVVEVFAVTRCNKCDKINSGKFLHKEIIHWNDCGKLEEYLRKIEMDGVFDKTSVVLNDQFIKYFL